MYMLMIKQQMSKKIYTYEMLLWASPLVIQRFSFHCHLCGKKLSNYLGGNGKGRDPERKEKRTRVTNGKQIWKKLIQLYQQSLWTSMV